MNTKLLILLAFLFAFMNVKAQPPYVEKIIDIHTTQYADPINFIMDGDRIYMGSSYHQVYISNIDSAGNVYWESEVFSTGCYKFLSKNSNILSLGDYIYLSGSIWNTDDSTLNFHGPLIDCSHPSGQYIDYALTKTSKNGGFAWTRCYGGYGEDLFGDQIISSGKNSIILGGGVYLADSGDYTAPLSNVGGSDIWLVDVDTANGSIIREKCFGTLQNDFLNDLTVTHDNGYLLCGNTGFYPGNNADQILIKIDSLWNEEWRKILPTPGKDFGSLIIEDTLSGSMYWMVCTNETDSIFHTNIQSINFGGDDMWDYNLWVIKLNKSGDTIWTKCIGTPYSEDILNHNINMILNNNHEIIITTSSRNDSTQFIGYYEIRFLKLDTLGNVVSQKTFPHFSEFSDIIALDNNRYLCINEWLDEDYMHQLVYLNDNVVGIGEEISNPIKIFPNPAEDFVSIELPPNHTQAQLNIYNLTGQLISQKQLTQSSQQLSIPELGNGMYIFVVQNGDKVIGRNRVVISK